MHDRVRMQVSLHMNVDFCILTFLFICNSLDIINPTKKKHTHTHLHTHTHPSRVKNPTATRSHCDTRLFNLSLSSFYFIFCYLGWTNRGRRLPGPLKKSAGGAEAPGVGVYPSPVPAVFLSSTFFLLASF